ncbi:MULTISPECIES: general stress protein [Paenibacillus]|uniref:General stress protein n=1 Tax=Paenibacillus campinasensis TaxID=66347 RepID=A0A268EMV1_9BACL|nr:MULTISPECIES: general stress protein [Paenibacillus]MUG66973.1 general stress protein [Paenibacillus campinasensis]PAD74438.1 general stress protein [Paenibacillus campinasensis]PAK50836.1 general stress protein [Paenibacillus sp. 7541]
MSSTNTKSYAKVVENGTLAAQEIENLHQSGYTTDQIYVLAHDSDKTSKIAEVAGSREVGMKEEGLFGSFANLFRSRGDELRAKIESLGFTAAEAAFYEKQLDIGKVLVIAVKNDE